MDTISQEPGPAGEGDGSSEQNSGRVFSGGRSDTPGHPPAAVHSLKQAMRRARFDDAERSGAISDLRAARIGRLDVLHEALKPVLAQIPDEIDCFDVGIMPGSNPRLFIDMIGFVEMGRDPRVYSFLQDTRHGRVRLAESDSVDKIVEAATHYIARRLLERDKALASDPSFDAESKAKTDKIAKGLRAGRSGVVGWQGTIKTGDKARPARHPFFGLLGAAFGFVIDLLGAVTFFSLLAFAAWIAWSNYKH